MVHCAVCKQDYKRTECYRGNARKYGSLEMTTWDGGFTVSKGVVEMCGTCLNEVVLCLKHIENNSVEDE